jgi:hypothetical protein
MRDAEQHLGVVRQKGPTGCSVPRHNTSLANLDSIVVYSPSQSNQTGVRQMKILDRLSNSPPRNAPANSGAAEASSPDQEELPIADYDKLDAKQLRPQLSPLSQVELAAVESYELAHQARPVVLNRLHWLKGSEPVSGYDALTTEQIVQALAEADTGTVKAVREYERRHQDRHEVRAEIARVLPTALASVGEDRARDEQAALVQEGFAGREKTRADLAGRRSAADDPD